MPPMGGLVVSRWSLVVGRYLVLLVAAGMLASAPVTVAAQKGRMRLLVSNGVKAALVAVQPGCETQTGFAWDAEFGTSNGLRAAAAKGQPFDIAVMTEDAIDAMVSDKRLDPASKMMVAKTRIGAGVRQNATAPDVRTADAVRKALLGASSVTWASDGASRPFIEKMVATLGITAQIAGKTHTEQGSPRATARVVNGQSDIVLTLISEIVPVAGLKMVGALPAEFQGEMMFAPATSSSYSSVGLDRSAR